MVCSKCGQNKPISFTDEYDMDKYNKKEFCKECHEGMYTKMK